MKSVAYGNGRFVGPASGSTTSVAISTDGTTWANSATLPVLKTWGLIGYGGGKFLVISSQAGSSNYAVSVDGLATSWTGGLLPVVGPYAGVAYGNGVWVVTTKLGISMISTDGGVTFTTTSFPLNGNVQGPIAFDGVNMFATVGASQIATVTAAPALTWTAPAGVNAVQVLAVGGGGAGGGTDGNAAGGGGGGGQVVNKLVTVASGTVYPITVGWGGQAGTASSSIGGSGQTTAFGTLLTALGGGGGGGAGAAGGNAGGNGGGANGNATIGCGAGGGGGAGGVGGSAHTVGTGAAVPGAPVGGGSWGGDAGSSASRGGVGGPGLYGYGGGGGGGSTTASTGAGSGANGGGRAGFPGNVNSGGGGGGGTGTVATLGRNGGSGYVCLTWWA
jgi:hypothetical protein